MAAVQPARNSGGDPKLTNGFNGADPGQSSVIKRYFFRSVNGPN